MFQPRRALLSRGVERQGRMTPSEGLPAGLVKAFASAHHLGVAPGAKARAIPGTGDREPCVEFLSSDCRGSLQCRHHRRLAQGVGLAGLPCWRGWSLIGQSRLRLASLRGENRKRSHWRWVPMTRWKVTTSGVWRPVPGPAAMGNVPAWPGGADAPQAARPHARRWSRSLGRGRAAPPGSPCPVRAIGWKSPREAGKFFACAP